MNIPCQVVCFCMNSHVQSVCCTDNVSVVFECPFIVLVFVCITLLLISSLTEYCINKKL